MCKMMIVDDEQPIREVFYRVLTNEGFPTVRVSSGEEALFELDRRPTIRVVYSDLYMRGMDGMTLCRKIKKMCPLMIVIAVTGRSNLFSLSEARQAGFDDYLLKPVSVGFLRDSARVASAIVDRWSSYK